MRPDDGGEKASMQISSKRRTHSALSNWRRMVPLIGISVAIGRAWAEATL